MKKLVGSMWTFVLMLLVLSLALSAAFYFVYLRSQLA